MNQSMSLINSRHPVARESPSSVPTLEQHVPGQVGTFTKLHTGTQDALLCKFLGYILFLPR